MRGFVRLAAAFYGALAVGAILWCTIAGRPVFWIGPPPTLESVLQWSGVGLLFGLIVVLASDWAEQRFKSMQELSSAFRDVLGDVSWPEAFLLGVLSSFGEEMFFRGALLPAVGLVASTLIFAAVHWPMDRRMLVWPIFAGAVGLFFGWAFQTSGHLAAPIVGHFVINFLNLGGIGAAESKSDD